MHRVRTTSLVHIVARTTLKPSEYPCMTMRHATIGILQSIPRTFQLVVTQYTVFGHSGVWQATR
jgi:hypothetical protein